MQILKIFLNPKDFSVIFKNENQIVISKGDNLLLNSINELESFDQLLNPKKSTEGKDSSKKPTKKGSDKKPAITTPSKDSAKSGKKEAQKVKSPPSTSNQSKDKQIKFVSSNPKQTPPKQPAQPAPANGKNSQNKQSPVFMYDWLTAEKTLSVILRRG